jgi:hypothetical protein
LASEMIETMVPEWKYFLYLVLAADMQYTAI